MLSLLSNPLRGIALFLLLIFAFLTQLIGNADLMEGLRVLQISLAVVVVTAYVPHAWAGLKAPQADRVQQISFGIALAFIGVIGTGLWSLLWRLAERPDWMVNSDVNAFFVFLNIAAAMLHVSAPGAISGIVPMKSRIALGLAFGAGACLTAALLTAAPSLRPLADMLQPYFYEP